MVNVNWSRWIFASITKHFYDNLNASLKVYVEGQRRVNLRDQENFCEVRVDGPYLTEVSKGNYRIYSEVNVVVQHHMSDSNWHTIHTNIGLVQGAFTTIPIYKYGSGVQDDDSLLCCLELVQDARNDLETNQLGQIGPDKQLMMATIEGHYECLLEV